MCFDIEWLSHSAGSESQIESSVQSMKFSAFVGSPNLVQGKSRIIH
jgi:hypothetical protein